MAKRRANGEGNIRKRKDGRWEVRYTAGRDANGRTIYKNVLGKTQAEVKEKLKAAIESTKGLDIARAGEQTIKSGILQRSKRGRCVLQRIILQRLIITG